MTFGRFGLLGCVLFAIGCGGGGDGGEPDPAPPTPVASVVVEPGDTAVVMQASAPLRVTLRDAQGNVLADRTITWSSSNPAVAEVQNGALHAKTLGTATVTATSEGISGSSTVRVIPLLVITPELPSLLVGDSLDALVEQLTDIGTPAGPLPVTWTIQGPGLGTVTSTGRVRGSAPGTAWLVAAAGGGRDSVELIVLAPRGTLVRQVAFLVDNGRRNSDGARISELWLMTADGGNARRVSAADENVSEYAWSHDGGRLVASYIGLNGLGRRTLVVIDVSTGAETDLQTAGNHPGFSPDGARIAFRNDLPSVMVVGSSGGAPVSLTPPGGMDPEFSPDGRQIAYRMQQTFCNELWVMRTDGTGKRRVEAPAGMCNASWSPGGTYLAYTSPTQAPKWSGVWVADLFGRSRPVSANCSLAQSTCISPGYQHVAWDREGKLRYVLETDPNTPIRFDPATGGSTPEAIGCCALPNFLLQARSPDGARYLYTATEWDPVLQVAYPRLGSLDVAGGDLGFFALGLLQPSRPTWQPSP